MGFDSDQFRQRALTRIQEFKTPGNTAFIPIYRDGSVVAKLRPLQYDYTDEVAGMLRDWRNENREFFLTVIDSTLDSTKNWINTQLLDRPDRILFLAVTPDDKPFGQIGLTNFDFDTGFCELDNWIKGAGLGFQGGMTLAIRALMDWTFFTLEAQSTGARVFSDNAVVLKLHHRNGLREVQRVPLRLVDHGSYQEWVEDAALTDPEKYLVYLRVERDNYTPLNMPTE